MPNRLPVADAIRFICAAWVMWVHIPQSPELEPTTHFALFRLPTFVILSTFFLFTSQKSHPTRDFREYALARLRIIYGSSAHSMNLAYSHLRQGDI